MTLRLTLLFFLLPLLANTQMVSTVSSNSGITDDLLFDPDGNLLGTDYTGSAIYKVTLPDGTSSIYSDGYNTPNGLAYDPNGTLYMADNQGNTIYKVSPDGSSEVFVEMFNPSGIIYYPSDSTLIATSYNGDKLVKITLDGEMTDFSTGGLLSGGPVGLDYDEAGNLYVSNFDNTKIIKILPDGTQELVTNGPGGSQGFIAYANGYIYGTMFSKNQIYRTDLEGNLQVILGSTTGTTNGGPDVAKFNRPNGIIAAPSGDTLYVSDYGTSNIRMITDLDAISSNDMVLEMAQFNISPNPITATTLVSLEVPSPSKATLEVLNQEGKMMSQIFANKSFGTGLHQFEISATDWPAGFYYAVLTLNEGQQILTRKLARK